MPGSAAAAIKAVPWSVRSALAVFILPWVVLPLAVVIWANIFSGYIPGLKSFTSGIANGDPTAAFILVIIDVIGSFSVIGWFLHKYKARIADLGIRSFSIWRMILYFFLFFACFFALVFAANILVHLIYPGFNSDEPQVNEFTKAPSSLSLWALVIIPPFVEEVVFRGYMFPAFSKRFGLVWGALISSILFAVAHWQLNVSVYTLILGLLLCFLYTRLGSIIPGIGLHMLNNYIAYMALHQK